MTHAAAHHLNPSTRRRRSAGVMMMETLIAILIFSLGVIALVKLQAYAVKQSADAEYRTQAALLAGDLVSRMWASNRKSPTFTTEFATNTKDDSAYGKWLTQSVKASGLPKAADVGYRPEVKLSNSAAVPGAFEASITLYWQAPGSDANETAKHQYMTTVLLQ